MDSRTNWLVGCPSYRPLTEHSMEIWEKNRDNCHSLQISRKICQSLCCLIWRDEVLLQVKRRWKCRTSIRTGARSSEGSAWWHGEVIADVLFLHNSYIYIYTQAFARWDKSNEIWDQDSFWCHFLVWHSVFQHHSLVVGHQHYCTCKLLVQATWCSGCFEAWLWRFCAAVSGWQAYPGAFPQTKKNADETGNRMTGWRRFGMVLPCLPSGFRH